MNSLLASTLVKLALPAVAVPIVLLASRRRGIPWGDSLGLRRPGARTLLVWLGIWLAWIIAGELLIRAFHLDQAKAWPAYAPLILVLRILAIGLVGPFSEELVMRGLVFHVLRRTALGPLGAIALTAVGWAAMHYSYGPGTLALIAVDGLVLGLARHRSGSLWVPAAMHALGNLISIGQSLTP